MRVLAMVVLLRGVAYADEPDDLATPSGEHGRAQTKVDLPNIPAFTVATMGDGSHTVRELRVHGAKLLDTTVTVRGVVTWVYDCATANRTPGETDRALAKRIGDDPTLCERAKFYVGDTAATPPEKSLWIVDVPRPYNKLELERIQKADRTAPDRCEPGAKVSVCPPYRVGDVVAVTGKFAVASPHSERNSDGLLVFGAMQNATLKWITPSTTWPDAGKPIEPLAPPPSRAQPAQPVPVAHPMRHVVDKQVRDDSMKKLNVANRAMGSKQFADAEKGYGEATAAWPGNHLAWYGLGGALAVQARWAESADAFAQTVQLRPDLAMYQMWYGVALYERAVAAAREDLARKSNQRPEDVQPDLGTVNFEKPLQHLLEALQRDPDLWRAQYYVGRIFRAGGKAREAAESFSRAIAAQPRDAAPYIALGELYRKWDYTDEAIKVAIAGTQNIPSPTDAADVWYMLGMGYDDKRMDREAIDAFTKAIDASPDHAKAQFQRGQVFFRIHERAKAKADLEAFLKTAPASLGFAKQQASAMLMDLAARK